MSGSRNQRSNGQKRSGRQAAPRQAGDMWRPVPPLPEVTPLTPVDSPTALIRSLGDPPLAGKGVLAGHYLSTVIERSAGLATALAASADLLRDDAD
jgi:hypothetical protein